jgi:predicted DsbA family dithiol-disulfide isomerase
MKSKMKIEIWSDIVCPFCYIGKRKFDNALAQFEHKDSVELIWHSYQLFPDYQQKQGSNFFEEVGKLKGISKEQSIRLHNQITQYAKAAGLDYNFDSITFPNTFMAHRFAHYAKKYNLQNEAEERLFAAYFTEGKNIDNINVLAELGREIGLEIDSVKKILNTNLYADEVKKDIEAARDLNISGVPYFLIDNEFSISGAQDATMFLKVMEQAWEARKKAASAYGVQGVSGNSCDVTGRCD